MAKQTKTFYKCDMCGVEMDKPYRGGERGTYEAHFQCDYAVAGHIIEWKETCASCNDLLGRMIYDLVERAKAQRQARKERLHD